MWPYNEYELAFINGEKSCDCLLKTTERRNTT